MRRTQRLGRYHLTDRIAYGGMAEIFRGFTFTESGERRDVAVKRLLPNYTEDSHFIDMIVDEFRLVSQLRHPNIAEVFELAEANNIYFIAMEYVDGKDLRTVAERAKRADMHLGFDNIAYIMARALDGLHYAHTAKDERGEPLRIVHRDFSPSNVLLSYDGWVKICDFGIAKATHSRIQTKTGIIKGKVKYMSPEQAFGKKLDWRSDIFSAGSVLYELITGETPFKANSEIDLIFAVRDAQPKPVREYGPEIPRELADIVERSMARSRSARYQSALEFRDALIEFLKTYHPQYRRGKLAKLMKKLCSKDIDRELRMLEDLVVDITSSDQSESRNLIADTLGPNAPYTRFTAQHSGKTAPSITLTESSPPNDASTTDHDEKKEGARRTSSLKT